MIKLLISQMADTLFKATMMPPGSGWEAIPRGKKGGYRRRSKTGKGYEYWYADQQHATSGHQLGLFGEPEHKEEPKHERERAETEHAASHAGSAAPVAAATRGERQDRGDDEGAGAAARREESGQAKPAEVAPAPAPVEEPKAPVVPQEEKPTAQVIIETLKQELEGKVLDGAAAAELSQTVDVRPWKPDPAASPAIALHADLMPTIEDEFRLPEHIKNFPNPHPLKDQEGKVVGHIDKLFSHQTEAAERILQGWESSDGILLSDSAGLGKSNTALAAVLARGGKRNLIVVPTGGKAQLKAQWSGPTAAGLFGVQLKGVEEITPEAEGTFIVSYDELTERVGTNEHTNKAVHGDVAAIHGGGWDTIVFDECQAMANMGGVRTESALRLQDKAGKVLYMSATPYTGIKNMHYLKRMGLWDETAGESFENWAIGAGAQRDKKSGQLRNPSSPLPLAALAATLHVDGKVIQRTTSLEGCNSKFDEIKIKDVPEEHYKAFDLADKILEVAANQGQLAPRFIKSAYIGWARTYWENLKAEKAIELGKTALAEGKQVAIFTSFKQGDHGFLQWIPGHLRDKAARAAERDQHGAAADYTAAADRIEELLGEMPRMAPIVKRLTDAFGGVDKVAEIHGATSKKAADEQSAYQSGRKKVCVATVDKGGTGISLHDTSGDAPRVQINLSIPWSAIKFNQVAGRSHRLGSRSETKMHWIMGEHDSEKYTAAICAGRLKSMGSLCAGDPDQQVSAQDMATWEFGDEGGEPEDYAKAVELAAIMDEEEAEARRTGSEHMPTSTTREDTIDASEGLSEKTRDYFRMFAEQRKAGLDVMGTQRKEREEKKRKERLLESHRAAEQLRQGHGYKIEHRPDMGGFVLSNTLQSGERVPFDHNRNIKSKTVGGRYKPNLQGWLIPEENMGELARLQKVQHIDVDLRQAKEYSKEQATAREEKKAAHAQAILDAAAAVEGAKKAEGEQTKEGLNPHEAAMRDLRSMGLHAEIYHNSLGGTSILLRGNTYDHKEAIKVGARGQAQFHGGEQGWVIPLTSLPAVADEVMGRKLPFDEAKKAAEAAGGGVSPLESSRGWRIRPHSEGRLGIFGNTYHQKDQIKRVPGARWDPNSKVWHIPESSLPILENIFAKSEPRLTINARMLSELF